MRAAVNALCVIFVCCCCYWMIPCQAEFVNMSMAKDYLYGGPDVDLFWPGEEENRKDEEAVKEGNNEEEEEPERVESDEQRLMRRLVSGYDNSVRPVYQAQEPVDVLLGLTLTQILDLDEKNQVLTTNVWLEASCVDDYTQGYMPSLAMVYDDSRVFWGPVIRFRSSCKIDITFFPFDTQMCRLKMGSWAYTGEQARAFVGGSVMVWGGITEAGKNTLVTVREFEAI
ncbi:neuronal acetylcholine receptor subunit alpha-5 [Aplysia californica]|uniref:Neuronal acetylcholine receptor subunit alpha-5 n=1 Tax=Aplysia californica TaxID=6500 RepID=A0ABM1A9E4_APLCA|nr:neuronal acetylcholine receptor subunit alpha-5 [Aplysia californica]